MAEIACSEIKLLSIEGDRTFETCREGTDRARDLNGSGRRVNATIELVQGVDREVPGLFMTLRIEAAQMSGFQKQKLREFVETQFAPESRNWGPGRTHGPFEIQEFEAKFTEDSPYVPCAAFIHHWRPQSGSYRSILGGTFCTAPGRLTAVDVDGFLDSLRY